MHFLLLLVFPLVDIVGSVVCVGSVGRLFILVEEVNFSPLIGRVM